MEKLFQVKASGSNVRTEIAAGLTTFFTMAYIIFVNPSMLALAGMNQDGVFVATCLAAAIGTLVMAFVANVPYATAPGMGLNAFFTFTVVKQLGFTWNEALAMVFICGLINIVITVTKLRKAIIRSIPESLQNAIGGGIGLFIAYIGMKNAGFLNFTLDPGSYFATGDVLDPATSTIIGNSQAVPALVNFDNNAVYLALIGLFLTVLLMVMNVKGAIFIGIIATTLIGIPMGVTMLPQSGEIVNFSRVGGIKDVAFAFFGESGLFSMFSKTERVPLALITIFAFSLSDTFDTIARSLGRGVSPASLMNSIFRRWSPVQVSIRSWIAPCLRIQRRHRSVRFSVRQTRQHMSKVRQVSASADERVSQHSLWLFCLLSAFRLLRSSASFRHRQRLLL